MGALLSAASPRGARTALDDLLGLAPRGSGGGGGDKPAVTPSGNPLPPVVHARLRAGRRLRASARVIVVGDIHGCADELRALLGAVGYEQGRDTLVVTGDVVTKGPASPEVVAFLRRRGALLTRGNNDDAALAAYAAWQRGGAAPDPKFAFVAALRAPDVEYLAAAPFSLSLPDYGAVVVHGGLVPGLPLAAQDLRAVLTMRLLFRAPGGAWQPCEGEKFLVPLDSEPWAPCWPGPAHCLFGHDSKRLLQRAPYATGLDTACSSGGALTAAVLPPLRVLRRSRTFVRKLKAREPLTFEDLQGEVVSVPSQQPVVPSC